jgi:predicted secreted hydrolase
MIRCKKAVRRDAPARAAKWRAAVVAAVVTASSLIALAAPTSRMAAASELPSDGDLQSVSRAADASGAPRASRAAPASQTSSPNHAAATADGPRFSSPSPDVVPGRVLQFPADEGAHPEFRTEWWYITGWLRTDDGQPLGFQVTFFRTRPDVDERNPSAFTPRQLVIAHAAVSDPARGRLYKGERIARAALGLAGAEQGRTRAWIRDWHLESRGNAYHARIGTDEFGYELTMERTQPPMRNGDAGYSRKGPDPRSASYYYSVPQLQVSGTVRLGNRTVRVTGTGWLDQEWSTAYLDAEASGWDWLGINLEDGGALMAFRIRRRDGAEHWAAASLRTRDGTLRTFGPEDVEFAPGRTWRSPRTNVVWPVEWQVRVGERRFTVRPLMDDQEKDARVSTGIVYWEGAVTLGEGAGIAGRGYLELTGYGEKLRLP